MSRSRPKNAHAGSNAAASSTRRRAQGGRRAPPNLSRMGANAVVVVLGDAISGIQRFIQVFVLVYGLIIFVYILTSWVRLPYSLCASRIQGFLRDVCEPYLRLFRRVLPPLGPLDLSPIVAIFVLYLCGWLAVYLLGRL